MQPRRQDAHAGRNQSQRGRVSQRDTRWITHRWFEVVQVNPSGLTLTLGTWTPCCGSSDAADGSDGHTVWANSAALRPLTSMPRPRIRRAAGSSTTRRAIRPARCETRQPRSWGAEPTPSLEFEASQLDKAFDAMRATGITSVQDADANEHDMQMYKRLYDAHRLNMRVRASFGLKNLHRPAETLIGEAIKFRGKMGDRSGFSARRCRQDLRRRRDRVSLADGGAARALPRCRRSPDRQSRARPISRRSI